MDVVEGMRVVGGGNIGRVDSRDSSMVVAVAVGGGRVAVGQVSGISLSLSISRPLVEVTTVEAIVGVVGGEVVGTPVAVGRVAVGQVGGVSLSLSLGGSKSSSNASDLKNRNSFKTYKANMRRSSIIFSLVKPAVYITSIYVLFLKICSVGRHDDSCALKKSVERKFIKNV